MRTQLAKFYPMQTDMIASFPRAMIDQVLYHAMAAVYRFYQLKVWLFGMTYQDGYRLCYPGKHSPVRMSAA